MHLECCRKKGSSSILEKPCHTLPRLDTDAMCDARSGTSTDRSPGDRENSSAHHGARDAPPETAAHDSCTEGVRDTVDSPVLLAVASPSKSSAVN